MATYWKSLRHKVNKEVKGELKKDAKKGGGGSAVADQSLKEVKILLLGSAESGKSTLMKQLRLLHGPDYTEEEKMDHRKFVYQNILKGMQSIVQAMDLLKIPYKVNTNSDKGQRFLKDLECEKGSVLFAKFMSIYVNTIKVLWSDDGIRDCFERRGEFTHCSPSLADWIPHFLTHIDRIAQPDYVVSQEDFVRTRIPRDTTEGAIEVAFEVNDMKYKVVEVGGGQAIKTKWLHCFEDLTSVIFIVSLSDYDRGTRGMEESLNLFKSTVKCPWLKNSTVIILLNKKDVFEEKIKKFDLATHFKDYDGVKGDAVGGREFILRKFIDLNDDPNKIIYSHVTNLTEKSELGFVFAAVKDSILQRNVKEQKLT